ncbi:MAG: GntR family transcriptional regulator [Proteobacteria bacterium]|nr:GntR family transcriptional regulator [Pseudomonadota bacterium]
MSKTDTQKETAGVQERDETIYAHLHAAICDSRLLPGTRLPEDTLADTFGASRTIIRKVLQRLAHEGLIDIRPNRGAQIAEPSVPEARDIFATRRILECGALAEMSGKVGAQDLIKLRDLIAQEDDAQHKGDRAAAIRLSGDFHIQLVALAGNNVLSQLVSQLIARSSLIIATYGSPISVTCRHSEHEKILELLAANAFEEAIAWMNEHLTTIERSLRWDQENVDLQAVLREFIDKSGKA